MDALPWIRLHLRLECIGIDAENQLYRIPGPNPDDMARVYAACYAGGNSIFFQVGLRRVLRERLLQLPIQAFFDDPAGVKAILESDRPCSNVFIGKSYLFPRTLSPFDYPDVVRLSQLNREMTKRLEPNYDPRGPEVFAIVRDDRIVSACTSSREDDQAGEAWVWTAEDCRRRGYARQTTAAWAHDLQQRGKTPFYSHKRENTASQAVAQSMGLIQFTEDAGYG